jgi:hypothetical protein
MIFIHNSILVVAITLHVAISRSSLLKGCVQWGVAARGEVLARGVSLFFSVVDGYG